jgi:hypothetical protein
MNKCGRGKRAGKQKGTSNHATVCIDYANGLCTLKRNKCKYLHVVFSSPLESQQCDSYVLTGKCLLGDQCTAYHPCRVGVQNSGRELNIDQAVSLQEQTVDQALLLLVQHLQQPGVAPTAVVPWLLSQSLVYPGECAQITHHLCALVPYHCGRTIANFILDGVGASLFNPSTRSANMAFLEELCKRGVARDDHMAAAMHTLQEVHQTGISPVLMKWLTGRGARRQFHPRWHTLVAPPPHTVQEPSHSKKKTRDSKQNGDSSSHTCPRRANRWYGGVGAVPPPAHAWPVATLCISAQCCTGAVLPPRPGCVPAWEAVQADTL